MSETLLRAINLNESRTDLHPRTFSVVLPLEGRPGYLFCVIDLRGIDGNTEPLLNLFIEHIERHAGLPEAQVHLQHRFEQLVQTLNDRIAKTASDEGWEFGANEVNALVGIAGEDQLYLTGVGDLTALFLHRNEEQRYKVFNLFRGIQTEHHIPEWDKLLSIVLDGDLHPGDVFLVGNKEIPQHIDAEDLHQILVTLPPASAAEKIRQYFPAPIDLSLLILQTEASTDDEAMEPGNAESSLNHLTRTKDATSRILEHQRPRKQDWIHATRQTFRVGSALFVSSVNVALAILMGLVKSTLLGAKSIQASSGRKQAWSSLRTRVSGGIKQPRLSMKGLPKNNKRLLSVMGGIAIIFVLVVGVSFFQKNKARNITAYNNLVQDIEQTFDTASASIIYKDENQARSLLLQGLDSIASLPTKTKDQIAKAEELKEQFSARLADLRHTVPVESLELLASLPEGEVATLMGFDKATAYAFTQNGSVYAYRSENSQMERFDVTAPENFGPPVRSRYDDINNVLYLFDGRQIARFDPDQSTYELVSVQELSEHTIDIEYFAQRVYALSPDNEQVYRHDRSGSGFGSGTGWIQARTIPLRDAISLSVDGSVWILKSDGQIVRYQKGLEEAWPNPTIDPPLPASTVLWTTDQTEFVYLIDTTEGRLIQLEKATGKLRAQFTHEAFRNMKGASEQDGKIFVLTPAGLHQFTLE